MVFNKKPLVSKKMFRLQELQKNFPFEKGEQKPFAPSGLLINYSNKCNFNCKFCYTKSASGEMSESILSLETIRSIGEQAHELGIYEIDIQGGEPLLYPNLLEVIDALNPLHLTTNGWLLTQDIAYELAKAGIDRINVSIDSPNPGFHDENRGQSGAYEKALQALDFAKKAGMKASVNIVCGHFNVPQPEFENWLESFLEKGYGLVFNCACPVGDFRGHYSEMLTEQDSAKMESIRLKHNRIIRDLWSFTNDANTGLIKGCPAVNLPYINPLGDVLPCPYIHTTLGNVLEQPLKEILENGFKYKYFNTFSDKCLAGENLDFAKEFLNQETSVLKPVAVSAYFNNYAILEDFKNSLLKNKITQNQAVQIEIMKERYGNEYIELAAKILNVMEKMGYDCMKITTRYALDYIKEQNHFLKTNSYGHESYEKIKETIYDNEEVMLGFYMPGLFLAYSSVLIVFSKYHLFKNSFLTKINSDMNGIEIGFGEGFYLWELFNNVKNVQAIGFDISPHAKIFAEKLLEFTNISKSRYVLEIGDVCAGLSIENESKDFAIMAELIEHLPKPEKAMQELTRILKPNGLLYITTVIDSNHCDHITNFPSINEVESFIENFSFKILDKVHYKNWDDFPESKDKSQGLAFVCVKI